MGKLNIVILSGGSGNRFWPLKEKNLYTFLGETALIIQIKNAKKLNPNKIVVVVNNNITLRYPGCIFTVQEGLGMAGAVATALKHIDPNDELLIMGADDYYEDTLIKNFIDKRPVYFKNNQSALAGYKVTEYFPGGYLKLDGDTITGIIEKPPIDKTPSDYINMIFHYFPKANLIKESIKKVVSDKNDLYEKAIDNLINENNVFKIIEYKGQWKTIKYPWNVLEVMDFYLGQIKGQTISKDAVISKNAIIKGPVIIEDNVKIYEGSVINGPAYIGKGTVIANNSLVRSSMIGENCVVGFSTEVARSYLKNDVWLHSNYVGDSVLENNISLGSGTVTGNLRLDEQDISIKVNNKPINTHRNKVGSMIGSNVRVGINTSLMPGVKIGENSFIGPGIIIDKDIPENTYVKVQTKQLLTGNNFDIRKTSRQEIKNQLSSK